MSIAPHKLPDVRLLRFAPLAAAVILLTAAGCAVPQPRGEGREQRIIEPTTHRGYWLYLPKDYVHADEAARNSRRWPLVVSFHGMKPFDNAFPQCREWQQEADRYGFIVVAPELHTFHMFGQFPLQNAPPVFKADEAATLAILDHVFATTHADPGNVLSTSWSSGGYMAHYMMNRHPDRFTCLGVRQSNFSSEVMDSSLSAQSLHHPILIVNTQNDFGICREESKEAVAWYTRHGYKNVAWVYIKNLGHERTPDMAADFFGRIAGVQPNRPPAALAQRQAIDGNPSGLALLAGKMTTIERPPTLASEDRPRPPRGADATPVATGTWQARAAPTAAGETFAVPEPRPPTRPRPPTLVARAPGAVAGGTTPALPAGPTVRSLPSEPPGALTSAAPLTPPRGAIRAAGGTSALPAGRDARTAPPRVGVSIRVSSAVGIEPHAISFWAECPSDWAQSADFLWTLNGEAIGNGVNGHKTLIDPGEYTLGLLVVTRDGQEHRATRLIRVLEKIDGARAGNHNR